MHPLLHRAFRTRPDGGLFAMHPFLPCTATRCCRAPTFGGPTSSPRAALDPVPGLKLGRRIFSGEASKLAPVYSKAGVHEGACKHSEHRYEHVDVGMGALQMCRNNEFSEWVWLCEWVCVLGQR